MPMTAPLHRIRRFLGPVALTLGSLACGSTEPGGPDPSEPDPITLPIEWRFDAGLDGWTLHARTAGDGGGTASHDPTDGLVVLRGQGAPGVADAWLRRQVTLPETDDYLWIDVEVIADCATGGDNDTAGRITVTRADGTVSDITAWERVMDYELPGRLLGGSLEAVAGETVTITIEQDDEGEQEDGGDDEALCVAGVEIFLD